MSSKKTPLEEHLSKIPFHALEMCKLTSAEKVSEALLHILKDLQAYNEMTGVQSYMTEKRGDREESPLDVLIDLLDGLLNKGYKNRGSLFNSYYWAINVDSKKEIEN